MHAVSSAVLRLATIALSATSVVAQTCFTLIPDGTVGLGAQEASIAPIAPRFATTWDPDGPGPQTKKLLVERGRFGFVPFQFPPDSNNDILMTDLDTFEIIPRPAGVRLVALGVYQNQIYTLGRSETAPGVLLTLYRRNGETWNAIPLPPIREGGDFRSQIQIVETPSGLLLANVTADSSNTSLFLIVDPATGAVSTQPVTGGVRGITKVGDALYAFGDLQLNGVPSTILRFVNGQWEALDDVGGIRPAAMSGLAEFQGRIFANAELSSPAPAGHGIIELTTDGWVYTGVALSTSELTSSLVATSSALIVVSNSRLLRIENDTITSQTLRIVDRQGGGMWHELVGVLNDLAVVRSAARGETADFQPPGDVAFVGMVGGICLTDGAEVLNFSPVLNGPVTDLINFQNQTYAIGSFGSASGRSMRSIARRENGEWRAINMEGGPQGRAIDATIWNDRLTVAWSRPRQFSLFPDNFISSWDGQTWTTINGPTGVSVGRIEASATDLYCTGTNTTTAQLLRLVGDQWVSVDFPGGISVPRRLGNDLYVGATRLVGGQVQPQRAIDTGSSVVPLAMFGDRLVGYGTRPTNGPQTTDLYELRNGNWTLFAVSNERPFAVRFHPFQHELLAIFDSLSASLAISSWNGATWKQRIGTIGQYPQNGGRGNVSFAFTSVDTDAETGLLRFGSTCWALFNYSADFTGLLDFTPRVSFSRVPLPTRVLPGDTTTLRAQVISQGQFTYQWTRDNVALVDGVLPTGEVISGATTPTLTITNSTAAVNGTYMLTVTPVDASLFCGPESTFPVPVTVERFCDSIDFNNNFVFPEDQDIIDFLTVFAGGVCSTAVCNDIDFNNNDIFPEDQDVIDFFNVLAGSTCP